MREEQFFDLQKIFSPRQIKQDFTFVWRDKTKEPLLFYCVTGLAILNFFALVLIFFGYIIQAIVEWQ
jgi:hypothetical protein